MAVKAREFIVSGVDPTAVTHAVEETAARAPVTITWAADLESASRVDARHDATNLLSPRQFEVLTFIADGVPSVEIGERLGLSYNSIRTHRMKVLRKLGVNDQAHAVAVAYRRGILGGAR